MLSLPPRLKRRSLKKFESVTALHGFSGGGYNLRYILLFLARNHPETLRRIDLVGVLGAALKRQSAYYQSEYNEIAKNRIDPAKWEPATWDVVYETNPPASALPKYLPKGTGTHMFGPEWPLSQTPAGRYRDVPVQMVDD